jgi:hypothetical protein
MDKAGGPGTGGGEKKSEMCKKVLHNFLKNAKKNFFLKNKNDCYLQRTNISPVTDIIYINDVEFVL